MGGKGIASLADSTIFTKILTMRILYLFLIIIFFSCKEEEAVGEKAVSPFTKVNIDFLHTDSTSIRAIEVRNNELMYAGSNGSYGYLNTSENSQVINKGTIDFLGNKPSFRAIASTNSAFFMMSIENPALIYKYNKSDNAITLVYSENNEKAFYDAMTFWNDQEGIAMGDPIDDCLSILITRDGGNRWEKLSCDVLPKSVEGEAAFAASDTNIVTKGDHTWIVSGGTKSRVFYSNNKGKTWEVYKTPIVQGAATQGAYSMDFYDKSNGIIYGGDYTSPEDNQSNIAITKDAGKSWKLIGQGTNQGYKSCVQYVPNSRGKEIVATGFTGISYSSDGGTTWKALSDGKFLTLKFVNDSTAYAGGRNVLARLSFTRKN